MKSVFILFVIMLTACTMPPQSPSPEIASIPVLPTVEVHAPREEPKRLMVVRQGKSRPCSDLDTGDAAESINLKLDCLLSHQKARE